MSERGPGGGGDPFAPFEEKMRAEGMPEVAVRSFQRAYEVLRRGERVTLAEADLQPAADVPVLDRLPDRTEVGLDALGRCVVVKLNGGLGTGMGLDRAKSLIEVRTGFTFLDVIARQVLALREREGCQVSLVLMNSFRTDEESLAALAAHGEVAAPLPPSFLQHKVPKVDAYTLAPAAHPDDPELEWCPPGHGDLYAALVSSGMLRRMLDAGLRYLFVSNSDNLGATLDPRILGHLAHEGLPFLMEVARRAPADRKGGHIARLETGQLVLRESAQCAPEDEAAFQDVERHRYFNTNNLWMNLEALLERLDAHHGVLPLPVMRNEKTVDPRDPDSTHVVQLESAMGAAISLFREAGVVEVPRSRLAPVKSCEDLLFVSSDAYVLTPESWVVPHPDRTLPTAFVELDPAHYKRYDAYRARFPAGPPSMLRCARFKVEGDVTFGAGVVLEGDVEVIATGPGPHRVDDGAHLSGRVELG